MVAAVVGRDVPAADAGAPTEFALLFHIGEPNSSPRSIRATETAHTLDGFGSGCRRCRRTAHPTRSSGAGSGRGRGRVSARRDSAIEAAPKSRCTRLCSTDTSTIPSNAAPERCPAKVNGSWSAVRPGTRPSTPDEQKTSRPRSAPRAGSAGGSSRARQVAGSSQCRPFRKTRTRHRLSCRRDTPGSAAQPGAGRRAPVRQCRPRCPRPRDARFAISCGAPGRRRGPGSWLVVSIRAGWGTRGLPPGGGCRRVENRALATRSSVRADVPRW